MPKNTDWYHLSCIWLVMVAGYGPKNNDGDHGRIRDELWAKQYNILNYQRKPLFCQAT